MIFNGQGDDLQRIGGKPSVTWTLKLETRVTEGLLGTPRLSRGCVRLCVRVGGCVGSVAGGGCAEAENSTHGQCQGTTRVNACHNASTRQSKPSILFCPLAATRVLGFLNSDAGE